LQNQSTKGVFPISPITGQQNALSGASQLGGLSVNLRFFRKSLNELGNIVLFRDFCTEVFMG
jgi:hypothetical protein